MDHYDPERSPEPSGWLGFDEAARINLVLKYHEDIEVELPNEKLHAVVHVVVENQAALGEDPVPETLERLTRQGLDRHEAVHAVGAILADDIYNLLNTKDATWDSRKYRRRLAKLTAKRWRRGKW